ncbi:MAG: DUF2141 domain-containing protein [Flavobacteriaceae bacterium]|nr:DUF2141 domain-containing protein [Flavobacteriaceae bacterium]
MNFSKKNYDFKQKTKTMSKTILLTLTLAITSFILNAQSISDVKTEGSTLTVTVTLRGSGGHVLVSLHNEASFMKKPLKDASIEINDGKAIATFKNLIPGEYGIVVLHDKNDNKQMDFEPNGMPKEAFGISNNVLLMGPPQWSDAKFEIGDKPLSIEIRL